jgi:hypothetical protein
VRHARPLRFMARQANCFAPLRESAESITRKAYQTEGPHNTVMSEPWRRPKVPKFTFYPVPVDAGKTWRLLAHCPGLPVKYISGFMTKAEA